MEIEIQFVINSTSRQIEGAESSYIAHIFQVGMRIIQSFFFVYIFL